MNHNKLIIPSDIPNPEDSTLEKIEDFFTELIPRETQNDIPLMLCYDAKSEAYYLICHLLGESLAETCDLDATLDADDEDDEIYKLNRDITEDKSAYRLMEEHAVEQRSFEDIVLEYDTTYHDDKPLKVYGGQHRIKAIKTALDQNISMPHGVRVYFDLLRNQKVEIAIVNNTSITVPNDLLDRMQEHLAGPELREWCQKVGLLPDGVDFSDRKHSEIPTVRVARTLIVNYFLGIKAEKIESFHEPIVCRSGGQDEEYENIRTQIDWNDKALLEMGKQYAMLHQTQRSVVNGREKDRSNEFARKAISLAVVAGWGYASGLFQRDQIILKKHYELVDTATTNHDPLGAKDLSEARHKGIDPDTYRGLGARISAGELGRMLEVFISHATKASKPGINKKLANYAIESYEVRKSTHNLEKQRGKI